jgi:predicted RNA binding protein YcfA (HicA-like mRNA interferase family)
VPKLPHISGEECVHALARLGFLTVRQRGSHVMMRCGDRGCVVPMHHELKVGTLHGVLRQGGVNVDDFIAALQRKRT